MKDHEKITPSFSQVTQGTCCDCLANGKTDSVGIYSRRLRKETISDFDFLTHHERGIPPESNDSKEICSKRGLSINLFAPEYEEIILSKYRVTFSINPKRGVFFIKFRLKETAGLIVEDKTPRDPSHHNLFKADAFSLKEIDVIEKLRLDK